ncbi:nuclear transport factor 2 family protein [Acidipila sp. EB88]|uniref:nuclear transport factor 2 family protein n=1 Tax=Acidipila sp. EB88 TaxID=2305226 RepID=UPI001315A0AB|nr:nuclear transport factor 2 family protein [Acidipila sp. EB88]
MSLTAKDTFSQTKSQTTDEAFTRFLNSFGSPDWDTQLIQLMTEDVVMEFPFAPPARPQRLNGKEEVRTYFTELKRLIHIDSVSVVAIHKTTDPDVVIFQAEGKGRAIDTGLPFEPKYVDILTFRDGLLARWQDYWNPLTVLVALGAITLPGPQA